MTFYTCRAILQLVLILTLPLPVLSQYAKETEDRIRKVENTLAPRIVYGDTIPAWNLSERMKGTNTKGLSIAVIHDYQVEWAKGYGWADESEKRTVNTNTRFQAASISKSLNSLGILKLVEKSLLDPDADINTYLKQWEFPYDSVSKNKKINTWHLLSHTAGLSIHGFPGYKRFENLPTLPQILDGVKPANTKRVRSVFEPGLKFQYSGGGTTILQWLLTEITGRDYAEYMLREVLQPLGMINSHFEQPPADTANIATGYYQDGKPVIGKFHVYPEQAAAGLWTTPTDLAKYIIECQLALQGKSNKVLSKEMMQKRMTPYVDTAAAHGVFITNRGGRKYFNHNGGNEAFLCTSFGSLEGGDGVVIMINGDDFSVVSELLNSIAQVYGWKGFYDPEFRKLASVPKDSLDAYVGNYQLMKDTLTITNRDGSLRLQQNGQPVLGFKLLFTSTSDFSIAEEPSANFHMLRNPAGKIEAIELKQNGMTLKLPRIPSRDN